MLFAHKDRQRILSGPAKGMFINYDLNHRLQHLLGLYEREIYPYLRKGVKKSNVLIDIGANDGYYVLAFLKSGKKVIACEPGDISTQIISNAALNNYRESENFIIEKRLIGPGEQPGFLGMDTMLKNMQPPFFILVDIDGGESDLLDSCGDDFNYKGASWLVETHSKELEDKCIDFFRRHRYNVTIIKNAWWRKFIPEQRPLEHNRWLFAESL